MLVNHDTHVRGERASGPRARVLLGHVTMNEQFVSHQIAFQLELGLTFGFIADKLVVSAVHSFMAVNYSFVGCLEIASRPLTVIQFILGVKVLMVFENIPRSKCLIASDECALEPF